MPIMSFISFIISTESEDVEESFSLGEIKNDT